MIPALPPTRPARGVPVGLDAISLSLSLEGILGKGVYSFCGLAKPIPAHVKEHCKDDQYEAHLEQREVVHPCKNRIVCGNIEEHLERE